MPTPLSVSVNVGDAVIVYALAAALKTMLFTVVLAEIETLVPDEEPKAATSTGPLGTVPPSQFAGVFQSPVPGLSNQVAMPAKAEAACSNAQQERITGQRRRLKESFFCDFIIVGSWFPAGPGVSNHSRLIVPMQPIQVAIVARLGEAIDPAVPVFPEFLPDRFREGEVVS